MLGSGNLGLIYLMEATQRLTLEEIDERHPELMPALREHPHIGWLLVRSQSDGAVVLGPRGTRYLASRTGSRARTRSPTSPPPRRATCCARDGFPHVADIMVGSFYDPVLDEGCAFEELISFHGGLGGPQTEPFVLSPPSLPLPGEPLLGAAAVHGLLLGWRRSLEATPVAQTAAAPAPVPAG